MISFLTVAFVGVIIAVSAHIIGGMMWEILCSEPAAEAKSWYDPGYYVEGQRVVD